MSNIGKCICRCMKMCKHYNNIKEINKCKVPQQTKNVLMLIRHQQETFGIMYATVQALKTVMECEKKELLKTVKEYGWYQPMTIGKKYEILVKYHLYFLEQSYSIYLNQPMIALNFKTKLINNRSK